MPEPGGQLKLTRLKKQWQLKAYLSGFLVSISIAAVAGVILFRIFHASYFFTALLFLLLFVFLFLSLVRRRISETTVTRFLNTSVSSLQESTDLFLQPYNSLNPLQKLQVSKLERELLTLKDPDPLKRRVFVSLTILGAAAIFCMVSVMLPVDTDASIAKKLGADRLPNNAIIEKLPAEIKKAGVSIIPPRYTRRSPRQSGFNLAAEEGATVAWQIQTTIHAKEVQLIFNDGRTQRLLNDGTSLNWETQIVVNTSGFYQVKIDSIISDLYKVEVIKDKAPVITIQSPAPASSIGYKDNQAILLRAGLSDDYGLTSAQISATISSGQGEAVKFKEHKLFFEDFRPGATHYQLQKSLDCKALGMQPGDELYFFITVADNHNHETNSEVYIITLQDTTNLLSIDGIVTALDVRQEFFRSQRQIIIETEQLLRNKNKLSMEAFRSKSNDLGIDQQLLRLRYGKFLGEETNIEIGGEHGDEHGDQHEEGNDQKDFTTNANEILDQFSHRHDIADDASFFDPVTKNQLKKMLGEMWNAEIQLRTFLPREALVFENKALLILKDLQQKSRAYVPKTGFTATPLKFEKRLTGDLSKVLQPQTTENIQPGDDDVRSNRRALGILEQLKVSSVVSASSQQILRQAFRQLTVAAAREPSVYLTALASFRRIMNDQYRAKDISNAAAGMQKMLSAATRLPRASSAGPDRLSRQYFRNLSRGGNQQ